MLMLKTFILLRVLRKRKMLHEKLPLPEKRSEVIDACEQLLEAEVTKKSGVSGFAVKYGYMVLKSIKPGAIKYAVDLLLDDFIEALEPLHTEYAKKEKEISFGQYLQEQSNRVAQALLHVTDTRADSTKYKMILTTYRKLRFQAFKHVHQAVPALARLIEYYYEK
jgi:hypothetical protein